MRVRSQVVAALGWGMLLVGCEATCRGADEGAVSKAEEPRRRPAAEGHRKPPNHAGPPAEQDPGQQGGGDTTTTAPGPVGLDDAPGAGARAGQDRATSGNCEDGPTGTVWPRGGPATVAATDGGWLVAGYAPVMGSDAGEEVFVARVGPDGASMPVTRNALEVPLKKGARRAAPGLWVEGARAWVARVDGAGNLAVAQVDHRRPGAPLPFREVAEGVDARFAPALTRAGEVTLVAWVDGRGTPMRVRVARLGRDGTPAGRHDVTPEAMGGTAPTFVAGASPPELVFVDARSGMSPLIRVTFDTEGMPATPEVARTVGQVPEPPQVAAVRFGGETWVAYTAVGSAASAAVGLVPLGANEDAPVPLVEGSAYGPLAVDGAAVSGGAIFLTEAPTPEGEGRKLAVHRVSADGVGEAWTLQDTPDAGHPAVAARGNAAVAVVRRRGAAVRLESVRCP